MLNVYFTVDVEIWCDGWEGIDAKFPYAFKKYIYGQTKQGQFGLSYQLKVLNDYGHDGVFFVEPLFSSRFGSEPLQEIIALIRQANQSIELHLHTEWADEAKEPIFPDISKKRQFLHCFTLEEQRLLIANGKQLLIEAGVQQINAFRAGSFGFNVNTLSALRENNILVDSSYNACYFGLGSGLLPGTIVNDAMQHNGVYEVPLTVFYDRPNHLRHLQLCACSFKEMEGLLWRALEREYCSVVILSHNFELLHRSFKKPDSMIISRFHKLCKFLDKNRDSFKVCNFSKYQGPIVETQPSPIHSPIWKTGLRILEQAYSKYA